ncbi:TPA: hypothetical protein RQJ36_004184 [Vibrio vulnificus]|nr:hypothetical protein [Vibrio vulnificus]
MLNKTLITAALAATLTACSATESHMVSAITVATGTTESGNTCMFFVDAAQYNSKPKLREDLLYMANNAGCELEGVQDVRVCSIDFPCPSLPTQIANQAIKEGE